MPHLKTEDYEGKERRNGSRLRLSIGEQLRILTLVGTLLIGGILFYFNTNSGMEALAKEAEASEERIKDVEGVNQQQNNDILVMQTDVQYIKGDVSEVKMDVKDILNLLRQKHD
ncbi:hypothetical protein LCGC14_2544840 [marine sediment metagenome]|uniref:Uncharacterized protein n=1 Tax=marine sediment metagenome TaxID=412755 RepID=A0A0F9BCG7_9ZZZZ